jgi:hypothetical protein
LRVVLVRRVGRPSRLHNLLQIGLVWSGWLIKGPTQLPRKRVGPGVPGF